MNYILAENLSKTFGEKILFSGINISINRGQKVALIAKNGIGKSTLLKILVGQDASDLGGSVRVHRSVRVGYLDQEPAFEHCETVMDAIFASDNPALKAIQDYEMALFNSEYESSTANQKALEQAMEQMQALDAWDYEAKIKQILGKFNIHDLQKKITALSGGEQKRVALAAVLVQEPDFLVMDEPTNHLDMEMVEWLEEYLVKQTNMALLLVTHDRYFLDRVTNEILELDRGRLQKYKGNYSYFLEKKSEATVNMAVEVDKAQKLMKKELEWIRAQPKARTTKSKARIDAFDKIKDKASIKIKEADLGFAGIKMERIGKKTIEIFNIDKSYGDQVIMKDFTYVFKRRDRVGIVGKNGVGKSTFLNMLVGKERPDAGKVTIGKTLVFGYYTQSGLNFKPGMKVIEVIRNIAEILPMEKGKYLSAGQILDHFQFPYHMHQNHVSTLSGGEKRRLYLLTVLMENPNFLILDEPTNDLDLLTLNLLENYLMTYNGCLIIVSHDRYFMDRLVDHVFVFEGNGKIRDYPGNYSRYREAKQAEVKAERVQKREEEQGKEKTKPAYKQREKEKVKLSYNEQREFDRLEAEIEALETEKADLETKLNEGTAGHEDLMKWSARIGEVIQLIDEKTDRWLELSEYA